ncbi:DUF3054 domain-containing protein [Microbacterium sp. P04]|uniref:DUF3054 domain-containing protein n=1 Tax=Microbacterium sp. P04 TaxID=3366947 RepID=UPI00374554CB
MAPEATGRAPVAGAFVLDAGLVVAFAVIGRASHDDDLWAGLGQTAWPFLVGLVIGWALTRGWKAPAAVGRTGIGVWLATVGGGMLLRVLSGQGTALAFIIVATLSLLVLLVGWRLVAQFVARRASRSFA